MPDVTTTAPLDEVRGLVDERTRYEGWLTALETRRATTPAHVLERVRADYEGRLRHVMDTLQTHVGALRADEAALSGHHDEQVRVLADRRDTLAEVELRTLVGEFPADEGERQRQAVEGEIVALESTIASASGRLADLRGLMGRVLPEPAPQPAGPPVGAGGGEAGSATPASGGATVPGAGVAAGTDPLGLDAARAALGDQESSGYAPRGYVTPPSGYGASGFATPPRGLEGAGEGRGGGTPPYAGQSFADAALTGNAGGYGTAAAGGAGGGTSAPGMPTQEKTLKCPDCGAMNFPTEWYCEKCGGELAAL
jgi:hypothetical protein